MLQGKICIITGGAGSIGLATARLMLEQGARVLLVDLDPENLKQAQESLSCDQVPVDRVLVQAADVGDEDAARHYIEAAIAQWGRIDVVFCNAGISGPIATIADYPTDAMDLIYRVNVRGAFLACKYALPHMSDGGSIIINSSVAGLGGSPGIYGYSTAKHAQTGLMRSLAKEVAPRGIRVNTIHPGPVDNAFQTRIEDNFSPLIDGADATELMNSMIPMGRHATADEIARSVLYLASDLSTFVTGSQLVVDGGFTA